MSKSKIFESIKIRSEEDRINKCDKNTKFYDFNCDEKYYKYENIFDIESINEFYSNKIIKLEYISREVCTDDLVFFDLETTGLSTGAGTVPFLAGFASIINGKIKIKQFFLPSFSNEYDFLKAVYNELKEKIIVSYNGKIFDLNLIKARFVFYNNLYRIDQCNRDVFDIEKIYILNQIDLLFTSRRFFKGILDSCSLQNIEKNILNIERVDDIDGGLIPDIYYMFIEDRVLTDELYKVILRVI